MDSSSSFKKLTCGHCNKELTKTVFYKHKKLYYDRRKHRWQTDSVHSEASPLDSPAEDFDFGSDDDFSFSDSSSGLGDFHDEREETNQGDDSSSLSDWELSLEEEDVSKTEIWLNTDDEYNRDENDDAEHCQITNHSMLVRGYVKFLFMWQYAFRVSDVGISGLLTFIAGFLLMLAHLMNLKPLYELAKQLPKTVSSARQVLGQHKDMFTKYACCPSCSELYTIDQCKVKGDSGKEEPKRCSYIQFPDHTQHNRRKKCGTELLKTVKTSAGTINLQPRQVYSYNSIISTLKDFLRRPDFHKKCEEWRTKITDPSTMTDVYDGRVWKQFMCVDNVPFLAFPYNYALSLNVDWFQPFKHTQHSIGVMYLALQNLPRRERFLPQNVIIVGVIPGPHEPSKNINSFLRPLVEELKQLWVGVVLQLDSSRSVLIRAALICVACDIPAARKVCGFVGHRALRGCAKCMKEFPTENFGEKADYSGFDRDSWTLRDGTTHRKHANEHRMAKTKCDQAKIEREHGCRYSVLLELPYFDPVIMCIIDPMHNLLLGTAKHMLSMWKQKGLIQSHHFELIQTRVNGFLTPSDVGRIPCKISSGFAGFTAEQWRNWILL